MHGIDDEEGVEFSVNFIVSELILYAYICIFSLQISRIGSPSNIIDEDRSVDLELSTSSASCGTLSDDENIEEVRNFKFML